MGPLSSGGASGRGTQASCKELQSAQGLVPILPGVLGVSTPILAGDPPAVLGTGSFLPGPAWPGEAWEMPRALPRLAFSLLGLKTSQSKPLRFLQMPEKPQACAPAPLAREMKARAPSVLADLPGGTTGQPRSCVS